MGSNSEDFSKTHQAFVLSILLIIPHIFSALNDTPSPAELLRLLLLNICCVFDKNLGNLDFTALPLNLCSLLLSLTFGPEGIIHLLLVCSLV